MNERDRILRYYRASGDEEMAAYFIDLAEAVLRGQPYRVSGFLDPYQASIAETVAAHYDVLQLSFYGGYDGAERLKAAFAADSFAGRINYDIAATLAEVDARFAHISHRDVLGSLMGLGITREVVGDIIMVPAGCQVLLDATILPFVLQHWRRIGEAAIRVAAIGLDEITAPPPIVKEIKTTVASLRLDAVAAAGFGLSRTKMAQEIVAARVKVNWHDAKNAAQPVKTGDVIAIRGRGRVEVAEVMGQTKKGRFSIRLQRIM